MLFTQYLPKIIFALLALFSLSFANAHTVAGGGLVNGLMHPVFGADHLLAMVAVGILSVQMGGKAIATVPAAFLVLMLVGGVLGMLNVPFFAIETGIAASVFVLGIAIAMSKKLPMPLAMMMVGFFALFHGYAHGQEMPSIAKPVLYAAGFILATAFLHIAGVALALASKSITHGETIMRYLGAGISGIGFSLLLGL